MHTRHRLNRLARYMKPDSGTEGGSSAGGAATPAITPEVQALIDAAVDRTTQGLKAKNSELLGKVKDHAEQMRRYEGIDPDAVTAMIKRFADDEEAGLIKAGKIDEVLNKRTERMKSDYDKKLGAEAEARGKAEARANKLAERSLAGAIREAAIRAGALPKAMDDIVLRAHAVWRLNEEGDPVAVSDDEVLLGKDGKTALSPAEWAEALRETAPHLFPQAQGAGATGSRPGVARPIGNFGGSRNERVDAIRHRFPNLKA